jgi:hypothetical protein
MVIGNQLILKNYFAALGANGRVVQSFPDNGAFTK